MKLTLPLVRPLVTRLAKRPSETLRRPSGISLGPELAPALGAFVLSGTGVTQDANAIHFVAASNLAAASKSSAGLEDNATYQVTLRVENLSVGKAQVLLYGPTSNHLGISQEFTADGTYTFQLTTSAAGSVLNTLRVRATGTSGNNTFDITQFSVRKVL